MGQRELIKGRPEDDDRSRRDNIFHFGESHPFIPSLLPTQHLSYFISICLFELRRYKVGGKIKDK